MDFLKEYNIIRRKVKHIRININRDKNVKIIIPLEYPLSELKKVVEKRSEWIKEKQKYFEKEWRSSLKDTNKFLERR